MADTLQIEPASQEEPQDDFLSVTEEKKKPTANTLQDRMTEIIGDSICATLRVRRYVTAEIMAMVNKVGEEYIKELEKARNDLYSKKLLTADQSAWFYSKIETVKEFLRRLK